VLVDPAERVDDVLLPGPRPLTLAVDVGGGRNDRDERLECARSDLRVEVALQRERAEVLAGITANAVEQVRDRVAPRPVEAGRE
jgi:hypothetical protein